MDPLEIQRIIRAESKQLGFCFCGFTDTAEPSDFSRYLDWLELGFYGDMAYLSRADHIEKRRYPELIFENCKTIVVLGVPIQKQIEQIPRFYIADFAHYLDYHEQLHEISHLLMDQLRRKHHISPAYKVFTDSAPILERSLAVQAGLGWIGKNSMFIHPKFGSMTLLTEIFLDIDLHAIRYDSAMDRCGSCTRCAEICPTHCIDPVSRTIKADHCLSYLTIESKNELDPALAKHCMNHIFGCDLCVHVCPWNQKNFKNPTPLKEADLSRINFDITDFETLKEELKGTSLSRLKGDRLVRNIKNAIANLS